ncbi:hypothetical protein [Streptomyces scopuliridis]|uniref:hypothetical protein n=1 Tax=Streptomyces scopuliridis TaxID=452529 RepID=UPI003683FF8D
MTMDAVSSARRTPLHAIGGTGISAAQRLEALASESTKKLLELAVSAARTGAAEGRGSSARKELGLLMVALRMRSVDSDARIDYAGKSREYRDRMADVFREAGLTAAEKNRVSTAARQAAGNILRHVLTPAQVASYGLLPKGPDDRSTERKADIWALAEVGREYQRSQGAEVGADVTRLVQGALGILARVDDAAVGELSDQERTTFADLAGQIEDRAYELRMLATPDDADE